MNLITSNDIQRVNFVIKPGDFVGYEFETKEDYWVEEAGHEFSLFQLQLFEDGTFAVMVANWDEYCVHEEVTELFNIESIKQLCESSEVEDHTDFYIEYWENEE